MPVSENALHPYIKGLVEEYGSLNVTELQHLLRFILILDNHDRTLLQGRSDDKFSQIVRNVVAHAPNKITKQNGYVIDKTKRPAVFYAMAKNIETQDLQELILKDGSIEERKEKKRSFLAKKIDFDVLHKERSALGEAGERFALEWERCRLKNLNVSFSLQEEVVLISRLHGDGSGYDILSRRNNDYGLLYIEVKTTEGDLDTPFFISQNEKCFMEIYKDCSLIYRVYNYCKNSNIGEVKVITYDSLINEYNFDPVTYRVTRKNIN